MYSPQFSKAWFIKLMFIMYATKQEFGQCIYQQNDQV